MDIGDDVGSAVDFTYKLSFEFTGEIEKVTYQLKSCAYDLRTYIGSDRRENQERLKQSACIREVTEKR